MRHAAPGRHPALDRADQCSTQSLYYSTTRHRSNASTSWQPWPRSGRDPSSPRWQPTPPRRSSCRCADQSVFDSFPFFVIYNAPSGAATNIASGRRLADAAAPRGARRARAAFETSKVRIERIALSSARVCLRCPAAWLCCRSVAAPPRALQLLRAITPPHAHRRPSLTPTEVIHPVSA